MTIQNLRYIIEIARCHSISKAAKIAFYDPVSDFQCG